MSEIIKRDFILGDEWLYYKIYCGPKVADQILIHELKPLTEELLKENLIDKWFFIRYNDPDFHLRIRFELIDIRKLGAVIQKVNQLFSPYLSQHLLWKIQTDTYKRELERYGSKTITTSEKLFFYDSELVLSILEIIKDEEIFFLFILKCIDSFLTGFAFNKTEKLYFCHENSLLFKKEFDLTNLAKKNLAIKYRTTNINLMKIMSSEGVTKKFKLLENKVLKRDNAIRPLAKKILELNKTEILEVKINSFVTSHIHMFVNRAFSDKQRFYEMIVYDFLFRFYKQQTFNS
ncbi:thiopeptide-type bacteriocin biosynthesis protein [Maribacter sp. R86514]|uniref:thiopeptide-type bacteriocin biosynthesis protein n=1 Tax=Maribacter sp. R86514 TaxID=3093854 RepID=UPI0037C75479